MKDRNGRQKHFNSEITGGRKYDENGLKKLNDFPASERKLMMETYFKERLYLLA